MITFLSSPKPFVGRDAENQFRAIRSWRGPAGDRKIILFGTSAGIREAGRETDADVCTDVEADEKGLPLFGSIVERAGMLSRDELFCYVNCDIVLPESLGFDEGIWRGRKWLAIGQRVDLAEGETVDTYRGAWLSKLRLLAMEGRASLHPPLGSDYFVFPRGLWRGLPPVVIGRASYDNALIAHCIRVGGAVIDATDAVPAIHQHHGYEHVAGGVQEVWEGGQARQIRREFGIERDTPTLRDAGWRLADGRIVRKRGAGTRIREMILWLRFRVGLGRAALALEAARRAFWGARVREEDTRELLGLVSLWERRWCSGSGKRVPATETQL